MVGVHATSNRSKGAGQLMIVIALIALAAGGASALLFASISSGALISLLLFYLAPLPLMVAALGWGPIAATIGGIAAPSGLGAIFGLPYCIAFAVTIALPAWWLGHLALLGRPVTSGVSPGNGASQVAPDLEWYPVGRMLLWISGFAALTTMAALLTLGTDPFAITGALLAILALIVTAALMVAYALTGFAVLHTLTLALKSRALWLGCTYAIMVVFGWPVLAMVVLGLADAIFGFRQRYLRGRPPPLPAS